MKRVIFSVLILLLAASFSARADRVHVPFSVGERLTYHIYWGPFHIGNCTMEVKGIVPLNGHPTYHIVTTVKVSGFLGIVSPVDDTLESFLDVEGLFSRQFVQIRREGRHNTEETLVFEPEAGRAFRIYHANNRPHEFPLDTFVQDTISSLYMLRTQPLELNRVIQMPIFAGTNVHMITITPDDAQQLHLRRVGIFQAVRIEPQPTLKFLQKNKGRMFLWYSDDENRYPLMLQTKLPLGSGRIILVKIENGQDSPSQDEALD
jgi:hypothetical protein